MRRNVPIVILAILLAVPAAAANWSYRGSNEPDTVYDTPDLMFHDPDTSPAGHKIYFNAFGRAARLGHYSPNVAMLGTGIQPPVTTVSAILGFWKDCNGDGYMGQLESAVVEYRAELLLDPSVCPKTVPVKGQPIYPHNDGTWIREVIWLGPPNTDGAVGSPNDNPTNFLSTGTAVWGDWGLPGTPPVLTCQGGANAGLRSTGAILDVADCQIYFKGVRTLNTVQDETGAPVGGWEPRDVDNSPSPLNIDNPAYYYLYGPADAGPSGNPDPAYTGDYRGWGGGILGRDSSEQRRERMVQIVDCESDSVQPSTTVNTPGNIFDPATYPSLYESLNDTVEVVQQNPNGQNGGNPCNPDGPADEGLPYNAVHPEGYVEHTFAEAGRLEVDHVFKFSIGSRNVLPAPLGGPCRNNSPAWTPGLLGYCPPGDLGLAVERDDLAVGPGWRTNAQINTYTITTRDQALKTDEPDFSGWYMTFYARIGDSARALGAIPGTGAPRIYGAEACGLNTSGIHNFWNCDETAWIQRCADAETPTLPAHCYRVGFSYHMRDIDCWDNTVARGSGVRVGLSDLVADHGPCRVNPSNSGMDLPLVG